jgi:hypothetical protein
MKRRKIILFPFKEEICGIPGKSMEIIRQWNRVRIFLAGE